MNQDNLKMAVSSAREFLRRAQDAQEQATKDGWSFTGTPLTAAVRRQSMDLTRAVAQLRKPN